MTIVTLVFSSGWTGGRWVQTLIGARHEPSQVSCEVLEDNLCSEAIIFGGKVVLRPSPDTAATAAKSLAEKRLKGRKRPGHAAVRAPAGSPARFDGR